MPNKQHDGLRITVPNELDSISSAMQKSKTNRPVRSLLPLFSVLPFSNTTQRARELALFSSILKAQSSNIPLLVVSSYEDALPILSLYQARSAKSNHLTFKIVSPRIFSMTGETNVLEEDDSYDDQTEVIKHKMKAFASTLKKQPKICPVFTDITQYLKQNVQPIFEKTLLKQDQKLILIAKQTELEKIQNIIDTQKGSINGLENQTNPYTQTGLAKCYLQNIAPLTNEEKHIYFKFYFQQKLKPYNIRITDRNLSSFLNSLNTRLEQKKHHFKTYPYAKVFEVLDHALSLTDKTVLSPHTLPKSAWDQALDDILPYTQNPIDVQRLLNMNAELKKKIYGQDEAIQQAYEFILPFCCSTQENRTQPAVLAFFGPSGVGKTALANEISFILNGHKAECIQMEQYTDYIKTSNLIGSAKGYVNSEEDGILSRMVQKNPNPVILLDEFEKAHPKIQKMFLGIFDTGTFHDTHAGDIDCKNAIFILTSNAGIREDKKITFVDQPDHQYVVDDLLLRRSFPPELFGRLNAKIYFNFLTDEAKQSIIYKFMNDLNEKLKTKHVHVQLSPETIRTLIRATNDPSTGARPLIQALKAKVDMPIQLAILTSQIKKHDMIIIHPDLTWGKQQATKHKLSNIKVFHDNVPIR